MQRVKSEEAPANCGANGESIKRVQRVKSKEASANCGANGESVKRVRTAKSAQASIGFVAVERVFFGCASEGLAHFDRLIEARLEACGATMATITHIKSGLGNRDRQLFHFDECEALGRFVDQVAQWAIEGRDRC